MVFPLPFTPFEYYYWCDDRPESPTTFPIELVFRGALQREALEQAYRVTVARHPLLHALVDVRSSRRPYWIDGAVRLAPLDWADHAVPIHPSPVGFLDLRSYPGLRMWARASPHQSRLILQFHHSCCDALGAMQFIEELLVAYDAQLAGVDPAARWPVLDPARLPLRGDYGLSASGYRPGFRDAWLTARIWGETLLRRPAVIAKTTASVGQAEASTEGRPYLTQIVTQQEMNRLHAAARMSGATVNDLMLRDLFQVLSLWQAERVGTHASPVTINVPVSLRSRVDRGMPAANSLGFWFLHRSVEQCVQPAALLSSIKKEMAAVKKWRMPLFFVGGLGVAARIPGVMRGLLRLKRSFATAVFSNVGRLLARAPLEREEGRLICGNAVLERVTGVPPIRPGTSIAIVVATYGCETTLNLRYDPDALSPNDAKQLLTRFSQQLVSGGGCVVNSNQG